MYFEHRQDTVLFTAKRFLFFANNQTFFAGALEMLLSNMHPL